MINRSFGLIFGCAALATACQPRTFNKSSLDSETSARAQQKFPPYNAYAIWQSGRGTPVNEFPANYDEHRPFGRGDGIFFVKSEDYWEQTRTGTDLRFLGKPTADTVVTGAILRSKTAGGVISYPERDGRQFKLTFTEQSAERMNQDSARNYCAVKQLRLPTIRELFDFCSNDQEFKDTRCEGGTWSASRDTSSKEVSWVFLDKLNKELPKEKHGIAIYYANRVNHLYYVRCVGN